MFWKTRSSGPVKVYHTTLTRVYDGHPIYEVTDAITGKVIGKAMWTFEIDRLKHEMKKMGYSVEIVPQ